LTAHINIGSNLGHRADLIARAVSLLGRRVGTVRRVSAPVETPPWGYASPHAFLNVGVNVETDLAPDGIVGRLQAIELEIDPACRHRDACGNYIDRKIDIDLICLDDTVADSPVATVPHPRMHEREFVLRPMAEILPGWEHPLLHEKVGKLLENLCNKMPDARV